MKQITSRDNSFYKELLKLTESTRARSKQGQTLLDGAHLISAYLDAGHTPRSVLITEDAASNAEIDAILKRVPQGSVIQLDNALFAGLSELKTVTGILAVIDIPQPETKVEHNQFCLLLENIQDPGNVGSMLRSAAAAGCDAVYLSAGCADAWSPRVLRAAMGGHFVLEVQEQADLLAVADRFKGKVYAASLTAESSLFDCALRERVAFAIGNEGSGLSAALQEKCVTFRIPMPGRVESLNAAAAAAICLFEAVRQRQ